MYCIYTKVLNVTFIDKKLSSCLKVLSSSYNQRERGLQRRERARVNKLTSAPKGRVELVYDSCVCAKRCDRDPLSIIADFIDTVIFAAIHS